MDRERVHAGLRGAADHRRGARRPLRAQADVRRRGRRLHRRASTLAALSPSTDALVAARALQGVGAAIVTPLTLTLISDAFPPERRAAALGIWGGITGLGVALGPFVGGAVVEGIAWQWIFWANVPLGLALIPLAARMLRESHGPDRELDLPGLALVSAGLFGFTFGLIRGEALGWTSATVVDLARRRPGAARGVRRWETAGPRADAADAVLPLACVQRRERALVRDVLRVFGAIFLISQYFQTAQGFGPLEAGRGRCPGPGCR